MCVRIVCFGQLSGNSRLQAAPGTCYMQHAAPDYMSSSVSPITISPRRSSAICGKICISCWGFHSVIVIIAYFLLYRIL